VATYSARIHKLKDINRELLQGIYITYKLYQEREYNYWLNFCDTQDKTKWFCVLKEKITPYAAAAASGFSLVSRLFCSHRESYSKMRFRICTEMFGQQADIKNISIKGPAQEVFHVKEYFLKLTCHSTTQNLYAREALSPPPL